MVYTLDLTEPNIARVMSVLRKYNKTAYKYFIFNAVPEIRKGNFIGDKLDDNTYYVKLPFDDLFSKIYGEVGLIYTVTGNKISVVSSNKDLFFELYKKIWPVEKGIPIINDKAKFKLNLYSMGISIN